MGTALARSHAETDLALRAAGYDVVAWPVDGMDALAVADAAARAVESIRAGAGPHFLELRTYRFRAHSMDDPERYRDKAVVEQWKKRDPIDALITRLKAAREFSDDDLAVLEQEVAAEIDQAVAFAEQAPVEPVEDLTKFVYSETAPASGTMPAMPPRPAEVAS